MNDNTHSATIRRLFEAVRALPESSRRSSMLELGADPLQIAEVDSLLVADAETLPWVDGQSMRIHGAVLGDTDLAAAFAESSHERKTHSRWGY